MPKVKITGYVDIPDAAHDPERKAAVYLANNAKELIIESMSLEGDNDSKNKDDGRERHPSYGMIRVSRGTNGQRALFGSSILHNNVITIMLYEASVERDLHFDTIMDEGLIAEIELSQSQFADMITSMNMGGGTPCTIRWVRGKGRAGECPFVDKRQQFETELSESIEKANEKANKLVKDVQDLLSKSKPLTKAEKDSLMNAVNKLSVEINSNRGFIYKAFNEQMDATVKEAKGEVEAFMQDKILRAAGIKLEESGLHLVNLDKNTGLEISDNPDDKEHPKPNCKKGNE